MEMKVEAFRGKYRFLSNFYPAIVSYGEIDFPTVEHAYQAAKFDTDEERKHIANLATPVEAKRAGKRGHKVTDEIKLGTMKLLVFRKFFAHENLRQRLLETGEAELIEGNYWHDTFWGQCPIGTGENHLGRILMKVREAFRN